MKAELLGPRNDVTDSHGDSSWDAQQVWRERVRQGPFPAPSEHAPSQGWDPYLVWLDRVKKR